MHNSESTALATRQSIAELISTIDRAKASITTAFSAIDAAEREINELFGSDEEWRSLRIKIDSGGYRSFIWSKPEEPLAALEKELWKKLVERLEIRSILSVERAKQLDKQLASSGHARRSDKRSL